MQSMASSKMLIDRAPEQLAGKLGQSTKSLLCSECNYPLCETRQTSCGCRLCGKCFATLLERDSIFTCKKCGQVFNITETFKDRAVESELKRTSFPCYHDQCPWCGNNVSYREHIRNCKFAVVICPNPDCGVQMIRNEMNKHLESCPFKPVLCRYCHAKIPTSKTKEHNETICPEYKIPCSAGCDEKIPRKELGEHLEKYCRQQKRPCRYTKYGCHYKDALDGLLVHYKAESGYHLGLVEKALNDGTHFDLSSRVTTRQQLREAEKQLTDTSRMIAQYKEDINSKLNSLSDAILKMELKLSEFQDSFQELVLLVQTLQATSYNGQFLWKIPEVTRRRLEAKSGKTVSLYSAPFYTSRFGYKLCLRLYLDGDGSGKGTHLSFFLTIMKSEYDALLQWPFAQMVTLMLIDQTGRKNIVQCFKPEANSSSFWRPKSEMNVASGCPRFAPLSVLNDPSYIQDDTMFFKVLIDTSTLNQP